MEDLKRQIPAALQAHFPELGEVAPEALSTIMEGERLAYRVPMKRPPDVFIKSIPNGTQTSSEDNMRIQQELYDAGIPVPRPYGTMDVGGYRFTVEEFRPGSPVRLPQAKHLKQVASVLAAQHTATALASDAPLPVLNAYPQIYALRDNFGKVLNSFKEDGIPEGQWKEKLVERFMEKYHEHHLADAVQEHASFQKQDLPPEAFFRQLATEVAGIVVDQKGVEYITHFFEALQSKHEAAGPAIHLSRLHDDPNTDNVLFDEAGKLKTIIDYEYSQPGPSYMDLACAINTQFRHFKPAKINWDDAEKMVSSYHQTRPLTAQEVALLPDAIQARTNLISAVKLLQFSTILGEQPPKHFTNPLAFWEQVKEQRQELQKIAETHRLFPKDAHPQAVLKTFFPYLNTKKYYGETHYASPAAMEFLDNVETFLRKEKVHIPYDETLPPHALTKDFPAFVGLSMFRLNKQPMLHNQLPLAQYYATNMPFQRHLADLMFACANYCEQEKTGLASDMKHTDIEPDGGLNILSDDTPSGIQKTSKDQYPDFSRPVLFELGGLACLEKGDPGIIRNDLKRTASIIEEDAAVSRFFVTYPDKPMVLYTAYGSEYNQDPEHYYTESAMQFVQDVLLPAISPDGRAIHPAAERYRLSAKNAPVVEGEKYDDIEAVKEKFGNIRFSCHSYGSCFVQQVRNALVKCMQDLGYTPEETNATLPAIFSLNTGSLVQNDIRKKAGDFSQFNMVLGNDIVANNCADHQRQLKEVPAGEKYSITSPHASAMNYYNQTTAGKLFTGPQDVFPALQQRSCHDWEFTLKDGYNEQGERLSNNALPRHVMRAAIERGAAIAGSLDSLLPETEMLHHVPAFAAPSSRPGKDWGARAVREPSSSQRAL